MKTTLDFALEYIRRGWSIIPLSPRTKAPAIKLAPYLAGERRMSEEDARMWWGGAPCDDGIAIITGTPSGLVVIDVDPRNGGDFEAVSNTLDDEVRLCASTGGGGMHFFCTYPEGASIACGKTSMAGVDRKADGGYVVAAPSIHPNGQPYEWNECGFKWTDTTPSTLPAWVLGRPLTSPSGDTDEVSHPWVADTLANPEDCKPGSQENTLSRLCWWAARNLEPDIASVVLSSWLARVPLGNPHDPWTHEHLAEKLDRAFEKRPADPGNAGLVVDDTPAPTHLFETVAELAFPEQEWIVEDFAAPGCFTEIIGKVKKGKSTLTYQLIEAVRTGADFIGRKTVQTPVVLLTEQTGTSLKKTLERAGMLGADNVFVLRKQNITTIGGWTKAVRAATALCLEKDAKLIVVDTLSRLASIGGDAENSSGSVAVLDPLGPAKDAGIACIFVRHARKGQSGEQDEIADAARGSSAITGDMDIVLRLTSVEGDLRCLSWESRITDDPEDVYLEYNEGTYEVVEKPASKRESKDQERITALREAIVEVGERDCRKLSDHLGGVAAGWSKSTVDRWLKQLDTYEHGPRRARPLED